MSKIVAELAARGHHVVARARDTSTVLTAPTVTAVAGAVLDETSLRSAAQGADVIVIAPPASTGAGRLVDVVGAIAPVARQIAARLGVVGSAGNLHLPDDRPLLAETDEFPEDFRPVAAAHREALTWLRKSGDLLVWFSFSPVLCFGAYHPGKRTGTYRHLTAR